MVGFGRCSVVRCGEASMVVVVLGVHLYSCSFVIRELGLLGLLGLLKLLG